MTDTRQEPQTSLKDVLLKACPPDEHGEKSINRLARALDMTSQAVYKWIEIERIPGPQAQRIIDLSEGRITRKDLMDFVFKP